MYKMEINMNSHIEMYQSGEIEIEVSVNHETVWLNRVQLAELSANMRVERVRRSRSVFFMVRPFITS